MVRHVHAPENGNTGQARLLHSLVSSLDTSTAGCAVITAAAATIQEARSTGYRTIGYAQTADIAQELISAGTDSLVLSLADLTLRLRARPLPN